MGLNQFDHDRIIITMARMRLIYIFEFIGVRVWNDSWKELRLSAFTVILSPIDNKNKVCRLSGALMRYNHFVWIVAINTHRGHGVYNNLYNNLLFARRNYFVNGQSIYSQPGRSADLS